MAKEIKTRDGKQVIFEMEGTKDPHFDLIHQARRDNQRRANNTDKDGIEDN